MTVPTTPPQVAPSPSAEQLERMLDAELKPLPDLDELLDTARRVRDRYVRIAEQAQAEADKANEYINRLTGKTGKGKAKRPNRERPAPAEDTIRRVVEAIGDSFASVHTLMGRAGVSQTTANRCLNVALERGLVGSEKRGQKYRWRLTEAGMEYLTGSAA